MKSGFREFLKGSVEQLAGDQDDYRKHALKMQCRKLLKTEAKEKKAKRKAIKASKNKNR